ncbi:D-lactate dehydrogenase [Rosistilla carotiformis]|uniref:D-lactate dehydrogenase n=1 Tax=Rosistilla carotiformis TaxID=2528017 RepID=A0A518JV00_9BACT|nr:2-hydroxyacid dehydrogenase [Rosistilla carotiformis]QDV69375.1 D-lactate dehydrogenase [Rosistilla carotiformis]
MRIALFAAKPYDRQFFDQANQDGEHEILYIEARLSPQTVQLAEGFPAVCVFVNDVVDAEVLRRLQAGGTSVVALRSAGFNNVDIQTADALGIHVVRVPAYSPHSVAEHAVAMILALNRQIPRAYNRVHDCNFSLEGLLGFDLNGKTFGLVGTGEIGRVLAKIMSGFGCQVLAFDPFPDPQWADTAGVQYVEFDALLEQSDVISLHCPLTPETHHMIDSKALGKMKTGVMLINTSRGAIIETQAVIDALKSSKLGSLGIDVYEEEDKLFFENLSGQVIQDDVFMRLLTFPNVLITGHQAFFTKEALQQIASTTLQNISDIAQSGSCKNQLHAPKSQG